MFGIQSILVLLSCFVVHVYSKTTIAAVVGSDSHGSRIFREIFQNDYPSPEWNLSNINSHVYFRKDNGFHMQSVGIDIKNAVHILA
jgi:hypothetical protein